MIKLLDGVTANATSAEHITACSETIIVVASGTFGSGTVTLQVSPDGGTTWVTTGKTLTADGSVFQDFPAGSRLRVALTGATGPDLDVWISG